MSDRITTSLRGKLIRLTTAILAVVITATLGGVAWQSYSASQAQLADTQALITDALEQKGSALAENHALALRGMVDGNAFGAVNDLVSKAVSEDEVVVYGLFLDEDQRPWAFHAPGAEEAGKDAWKQLDIAPEAVLVGGRRELDRYDQHIWEYSTPVVLEGEPVGTIRYGLSTAPLTTALAQARADAWTQLLSLLGVVLGLGAVAMLAGVIMVRRRSKAITGPLQTLTHAADRIAAGDRNARADVKSGDELEMLAGSFNKMVQDLADSYDQLEAFNRDLEQTIAERTQQLRAKSEDVSRMLDNIHQGVFTLLPDMTLDAEYSANLAAILEEGELAGRDFAQLFFDRSDLGPADRDAALVVLETGMGNPAFLFDCNSHLLPPSFSITLPTGDTKLLEMEYVGIEDDAEDLERVLVIVRDVTALRALQEDAARQREALVVVGELLAVPAGDVQQFFASAAAFIERNRALIESHDSADKDTIDEMFRNAHTLKGNARLLGFSRLNDIVHSAEELYRALRSGDADATWDRDALLANEAGVAAAVQEYVHVFEDKLGGTADAEPTIPLGTVISLTGRAHRGELSHTELVAALDDAIEEASTRTVDEALRSAIANVHTIAAEIGKPKPAVNVSGDPARVQPGVANVLRDVFIHVLRNSIDHGIEDGPTREAAGKPASGTIDIDVTDGGGALTLRVRDDGRGLALGAMRAKLDTPDPTPQQLAEVPFGAGISTAESVTTLSGRGVGMDAVRQFLRGTGGDAWIELDDVGRDASHAGFTLVLVCGVDQQAVRQAS